MIPFVIGVFVGALGTVFIFALLGAGDGGDDDDYSK